MRQFTVSKGLMGYVVNIGCQTCGFTTKEELIYAITDYINDPKGMEKKYYSDRYRISKGLDPNPGATLGQAEEEVTGRAELTNQPTNEDDEVVESEK
jgi:hypothetical protein